MIGRVAAFVVSATASFLSVNGLLPDEGQPPSSAGLCSGGDEGVLVAELLPEAVVDGSLRLGLRVEPREEQVAAAVVTALEIVRDTGEAVVSPVISSRTEIHRDDPGRAEVSLPRGAPDGFYMVRATIVADAENQSTAEYRHAYLEVAEGEAAVIDHEDYLTRSRALLGVKQ